MTTTPISGLPTATSLTGSDTIVVVQAGTTKKATVALLPSTSSGGGGGGGTASGVGASQTVYADNTPAAAGLSNVVADGSTDDSTALQAQLAYIKATWNGGTLVLPTAKTMIIGTGLTVPANVRIIGSRTTTLKYTAQTGAAITINDGSATPLSGFKIIGPGSGGPSNILNVGTSTGVNITGARMTFRDLEIRYFYYGIDVTNANTYINTFDGCQIGNCQEAFFADIQGQVRGTGVTNSGERTVLNNCLIDNSYRALVYTANGASLMLTNTSIDYCRRYGTFRDASIFFSSCHLETNGGTLDQNYMFELVGNPKLYMDGCNILMGSNTHAMIVQPGTAPLSYGLGYVRITHSSCYFFYLDDSNALKSITCGSERLNFITAGTTTTSQWAPWPFHWATASVDNIYITGRPTPDAAIRGVLSSWDSTTGKYTITLNQAATTDQSFILRMC